MTHIVTVVAFDVRSATSSPITATSFPFLTSLGGFWAVTGKMTGFTTVVAFQTSAAWPVATAGIPAVIFAGFTAIPGNVAGLGAVVAVVGAFAAATVVAVTSATVGVGLNDYEPASIFEVFFIKTIYGVLGITGVVVFDETEATFHGDGGNVTDFGEKLFEITFVVVFWVLRDKKFRAAGSWHIFKDLWVFTIYESV